MTQHPLQVSYPHGLRVHTPPAVLTLPPPQPSLTNEYHFFIFYFLILALWIAIWIHILDNFPWQIFAEQMNVIWLFRLYIIMGYDVIWRFGLCYLWWEGESRESNRNEIIHWYSLPLSLFHWSEYSLWNDWNPAPDCFNHPFIPCSQIAQMNWVRGGWAEGD